MNQNFTDIAGNGLSDCITRDGQSLPTANLPMGNFKLTGLNNGSARADSTAFGQVQDGLVNWVVAGGTSDAITATYTPSVVSLTDGMIRFFRATASNATTAPTINVDSTGALTITKNGGQALAIGDIPGNLAESIIRYNNANTRWELMNPVFAGVTTGAVRITLQSTADNGWLMFDDSTFGSGSSGAGHTGGQYQALFTLLYNNTVDANCPILTSSGSATTRGAQGSASAAWAANCRMTLPKTLGRALGVAGAGSGLTSRALGQSLGAETVALAAANIPSITATQTGLELANSIGAIGTTSVASAVASNIAPTNQSGSWSAVTSISATYTNASPTAVSLMQPIHGCSAVADRFTQSAAAISCGVDQD